MREGPPLVVLVLGGTAERWGVPASESPLALAPTPHLDHLARDGRVLGVRLLDDDRQVATAAPLLSLLGFDPGACEISRASYLGAAAGVSIADEECYCSADFVSLFRETVADVEPGPLRPAETSALLEVAGAAIMRAGFRLVTLGASHHLAVAPRASVDPEVPPTFLLPGAAYLQHAPTVEQHAFAHRIAKDALEAHEINEVRRDLGGNGWDALWIHGPGAKPQLAGMGDAEGPVSAHGGNRSGSAPALLREISRSLKKDRVVWIYLRRGVRDAILRELRLRTHGLADIDRQVIGPLAELVATAGGRLLVLSDSAWQTERGRPTGDPVPALIWGKGIEALRELPFTEAGAAMAGEPIAPGYGLVEYVRSL
ncbi:MAG: hypothetical protein ACYTGZ_01035 [Planctomycetota bacterium]